MKKEKVSHKLAYVQARNTVVIALLLGLVFSVFQIGGDFLKERKQVDATVRQVIGIVEHSAAQAINNMDMVLAKTVITGLFQYDPIIEARITDDLHYLFGHEVRSASTGPMEWLVEPLFFKTKEYTADVYLSNEAQAVGTIFVVVDNYLVAKNFLYRAGFVLVSGVLRNILLSLALVLVFYYALTKPLLKLSANMASIDFNDPGKASLAELKGHEKDELGLLVRTGNMLLQKFSKSLKEQQDVEQELKSHKEKLETMVRERTLELERANSALRKEVQERERARSETLAAKEAADHANHAKSDFLATMSHEIRTPMNSILGMADLLDETRLSQVQRQYVTMLRTAGDGLLGLIGDILDLSKVESGHLELEQAPFNLVELVEKSCDILALRAHQKNLELSCRISPLVPEQVIGDKVRTRQILLNLVGNAIKFTDAGEVVVSVLPGAELPQTKDQGASQRIAFSVADTGVGIPKEKFARVFERFSQADSSTTRRFGGAGLGLSICKQLVEIMGGELLLSSEVGQGSTFSFEVDFLEGKKEKTFSPRLQGVRVLLVTPNITRCTAVRALLEFWGATVDTAEHLEQAQALLVRANEGCIAYSFVFWDSDNPGEDSVGIVSCMRLGGVPLDHVALMIRTGLARSCLSHARQNGIERFMVKPLKQKDLAMQFSQHVPIKSLGHAGKGSNSLSHGMDSMKALRVLAVDDSEFNLFVLKSYLEGCISDVVFAENGQDAVEKYQEKPFDVILMDMQMPVMDGYQATREIRTFEKQNELPMCVVIALTAYALANDKEKSLEAGCNDHLTKPVKKQDVLEAIRKHVLHAPTSR